MHLCLLLVELSVFLARIRESGADSDFCEKTTHFYSYKRAKRPRLHLQVPGSREHLLLCGGDAAY